MGQAAGKRFRRELVPTCAFLCRNHKEWTLVSSSVKAGGNFVVLDLNPATWYNLKVTAHNNAGFSVAEYEFATLTVRGGKYNLCKIEVGFLRICK